MIEIEQNVRLFEFERKLWLEDVKSFSIVMTWCSIQQNAFRDDVYLTLGLNARVRTYLEL